MRYVAHLALAEEGDGLLQLPQQLLDLVDGCRHHCGPQPSALLHLRDQPRLPVRRLPAGGGVLHGLRIPGRQVHIAGGLPRCHAGICIMRRRRCAGRRRICLDHDLVRFLWAPAVGHGVWRRFLLGLLCRWGGRH